MSTLILFLLTAPPAAAIPAGWGDIAKQAGVYGPLCILLIVLVFCVIRLWKNVVIQVFDKMQSLAAEKTKQATSGAASAASMAATADSLVQAVGGLERLSSKHEALMEMHAATTSGQQKVLEALHKVMTDSK